MRIALDATYSIDAHPSGIAVYSREILDGLARLYPGDEFVHCYRGKQLRSAPPTAYSNTTKRLLVLPLPTFRADVFHGLNQRVDRRPAKRVVSTFHDLFVMTGEYSSVEFRTRFSARARRAAEHSDLIVAVSEFTALQVHELLKVELPRIRVIQHGVHWPAASASVARENVVLFVGALQIRKNIARLVEAFETMPADWRLVLAGSLRGFGAAQILERIEQSRCRERIEVTGYISAAELDSLYRRAGMFAFPSLDEGFGIPVLEAMAHGLPVITSNTSALGEVAGTAALLVDPRQTEELIEALRRLAADAELRADLSARGLAHARSFTWEKAARQTYAVYRELMDTG